MVVTYQRTAAIENNRCWESQPGTQNVRRKWPLKVGSFLWKRQILHENIFRWSGRCRYSRNWIFMIKKSFVPKSNRLGQFSLTHFLLHLKWFSIISPDSDRNKNFQISNLGGRFDHKNSLDPEFRYRKMRFLVKTQIPFFFWLKI